MKDFTFAEAKAALLAIAEEADELQQTVGVRLLTSLQGGLRLNTRWQHGNSWLSWKARIA
jgi:hypothetical protein